VQRQFARLYKATPGTDLPRTETGLSPAGYAYLALTIAALTGAGRQVLLSRLVADVRAATVERHRGHRRRGRPARAGRRVAASVWRWA